MMMTDKNGVGDTDQMGLQSMRRRLNNVLQYIIYVLVFKRVSDAGEGYVETQRSVMRQHRQFQYNSILKCSFHSVWW